MKTALMVTFLLVCMTTLVLADVRLEKRLDSETLNAVQAILAEAEERSLPTEPLVQKALEGRIKGAAGPRIVAAVRALLVRLEVVRSVLGEESEEAELTAAASALYAGVDTTALASLRTAREESLAVPLVVLVDLIERGVERDDAVRMVSDLVSARTNDGDFLELRARVERDITDGVNPGAAAYTRAKGILEREESP